LFLTQQLQIKSRLQHIFMQLHVAINAVSNGRSVGICVVLASSVKAHKQTPERRSSTV